MQSQFWRGSDRWLEALTIAMGQQEEQLTLLAKRCKHQPTTTPVAKVAAAIFAVFCFDTMIGGRDETRDPLRINTCRRPGTGNDNAARRIFFTNLIELIERFLKSTSKAAEIVYNAFLVPAKHGHAASPKGRKKYNSKQHANRNASRLGSY